MLRFPSVDYECLGNLGAIARDAQTHVYIMPVCGLNQPVRPNLRAMDRSLGGSWRTLGLYKPSKIDCKYFYLRVYLTIFLRKGTIAFY